MNIESLKAAIAAYVSACRGILHDDALVFVQAVEAHIKEIESPKQIVAEKSEKSVKPTKP